MEHTKPISIPNILLLHGNHVKHHPHKEKKKQKKIKKQNLVPTSRSSSDRARLRRLAERRLEARIAPIPQNLDPCK